MAAPTYRNNAISTGIPVGSNLAMVATAPTNIITGDLLIATLMMQNSLSGSTFTLPSGWSQITSQIISGSDTKQSITYYKIASSSEPASYTWTRTAAAGTLNWVIVISRISSVDTSNPINISGAQANTNTNVIAPSITTTVNNCLLVFFGCDPNGRTYTPAGTMTEQWEQRLTSTFDISQEGTTETFTTAGDTGTRTSTLNATSDNAGHLIAIAPRVGGAKLDTTFNNYQFVKADDGISVTEKIR